MAGGIVVEVKGAKELRRALRQIEDAAAKKGMQAELKSAYRSAARVVEVAAKGEAPKRSGKLAGSIKSKATTAGASVTAAGTKATIYGPAIHWGWLTRPNKAKGWRGGPIAPNPFLVRAAKGSADAVADALAKGLTDLLDRVFPNG